MIEKTCSAQINVGHLKFVTETTFEINLLHHRYRPPLALKFVSVEQSFIESPLDCQSTPRILTATF